MQNILVLIFFKETCHERCLEGRLLNVTPNIEQILSFKLLEKIQFQEIFHWIDMCNISQDKNIRMTLS